MSTPVEVVVGKVAPEASYSASKVTLYGVPLLGLESFIGRDLNESFISFLVTPPASPVTLYQIALIYGFAYQGHCYSLPEPVAVVVDAATLQSNTAGCDYTSAGGYRMWEVDKGDRTVQLQLVNDTFEEVILKRNLAGMKPPLSYHSASMLTHRGGRLTET